MISVKEINHRDFKVCFQLDANAISLWSQKQWDDEFKKKGTKVYGLSKSNLVIGVCVFQVVLDEAQINYFAINQKFRQKGFGACLMDFVINKCEKLNLKKMLLEVSDNNLAATKLYSKFEFRTVGIRKKYYKDGSDALLKEKVLNKKNNQY